LKAPEPEPDSGRALGWARTYYPGVASADAAAKIMPQPGAEVLDVVLKLQAVPAHSVRGVALNPNGTPAPKVAITLGQDAGGPPALRTESNSDGAFEFPAVVDGAWCFAAEVESGGVKLRAAEWIEMAGRELEAVKLRLEAPFTLRGRVVIETPKGWTAPKPPSLSMSRAGRGHAPFLERPVTARADADGNFTVEQVYPGLYRLRAPEAPRAYYLDAVRLGEADAYARDVELSSGALPLTLVYKTNGGTVRGTVEKCASGGVVLVPQDAAMRWGFAHAARCDANGHYEITAVRPGEYCALAFTADYWPGPLNAARVDDRLVDQASKVTVRAGEGSSADLRAIAQPPY
jgi:hypothetical protein